MNTQIQAIPGEVRSPLGSVTPDAGATPAASSTPAKPEGSGDQQGVKVTITAEEYRNLKRHEARSLAFDKRKQFALSRINPPPKSQIPNDENADPEIVERLRIEQDARIEAERKVLRAEVTNKVRELLDRDEFKTLPWSTKALILKNPHMLSEADNVDEALLDIEDFVREQVAAESALPNLNIIKGGANPPGHETPPNINAAVPAPENAEGLEDISKLTGASRSQAVLRNAMRKKRGVQA